MYDGFNRLLKSDSLSGITTYSYDPAGNRTRLEEPAGDLTTYTWNTENHLVQTELPSGDVVTTLWDPINKNAEERIVRRDDGTTVTHYLWDNNNILRETDDVGATEAEYTYIPQPYGDLVSQRREAESHFYQFDALGSTTGLTDETGAVTDEYRYKAFGETVAESGATENPYQWVAREGYRKDEATGDYNLRERILPPRTGQFLSADPMGLEAGDSNFYRYVGNDPIRRSDPSGLKDIATICKARKNLLDELSCTAPETPASGRAIDKAIDGYNQSIEARLANLEIRKRELERHRLCFENRMLSWAINTLTGVETSIDLALAFLPVFSDVRDVAEVLSGTDIVTKEDLSSVERLITVVLAFLPLVSGSALRKFGKYGDRIVDELEKLLAALERLRDKLRRSKACEAISKRVTESIDLLKEKLAELEEAGQGLGDSLFGPRLRPSYEGVPTSCQRPDNGCNALSTRQPDGDGKPTGSGGDLGNSGNQLTAIEPPTDRRGLRRDLGRPPAGMINPQAHHDLPWTFRDWFAERGLNVNEPCFGRWVEGTPPGRHQQWSAEFEEEWRRFIRREPSATADDIIQFMNDLRNDIRFQ